MAQDKNTNFNNNKHFSQKKRTYTLTVLSLKGDQLKSKDFPSKAKEIHVSTKPDPSLSREGQILKTRVFH